MAQSNASGLRASEFRQPVATDHSILRPDVVLWHDATPQARRVNRWFCRLVRESGLQLPAQHCPGVCLCIGLCLAVITWQLTGELLLTAACLPFTLLAAWSLLMAARRQRHVAMRRQVLELTESTASHLASGRNIIDALNAAGDSLPDPLRQHIISFVASLPLHPSAPSLTDPRFTEALPELIVLGSLLGQQAGRGAPLSHALRQYAARLRKQQRLRQELTTASAAGRLAIAVMMCAPPLILAFYTWQDPSYPRRLWLSDTGRFLTLAALGMQLLGLVSAVALLRKVTSQAVVGGRL
ncbi:MAG: type II secretion system F family protein [Planctomycetaceae bacterium]|nr:type II secretion system F family protein [Planctomycetaceae bacterium]